VVNHIMSESSGNFWTFDRDLGCRCLYNGLSQFYILLVSSIWHGELMKLMGIYGS
jgi:hypothetical protein